MHVRAVPVDRLRDPGLASGDDRIARVRNRSPPRAQISNSFWRGRREETCEASAGSTRRCSPSSCSGCCVRPAVATADGKGKRALRIVATEIQFEFLDLGTPGPSLGDELVFSERLSRRGRSIGVSGVVCTATQVEPPYDDLMFHCVGTLKLRRGQITLQGLIEVQGEDDPGPFTVAITGGTGRYRRRRQGGDPRRESHEVGLQSRFTSRKTPREVGAPQRAGAAHDGPASPAEIRSGCAPCSE